MGLQGPLWTLWWWLQSMPPLFALGWLVRLCLVILRWIQTNTLPNNWKRELECTSNTTEKSVKGRRQPSLISISSILTKMETLQNLIYLRFPPFLPPLRACAGCAAFGCGAAAAGCVVGVAAGCVVAACGGRPGATAVPDTREGPFWACCCIIEAVLQPWAPLLPAGWSRWAMRGQTSLQSIEYLFFLVYSLLFHVLASIDLDQGDSLDPYSLPAYSSFWISFLVLLLVLQS